MNRFRSLLVSALVLCAVPTSHADDAPKADAPKGDSRVKEALDRLNLKYEMTPRGAFQVTLTYKGNRTQVVFVNSSTSTYGEVEYRDVTSTAYRVKGDLDPKEANDLLADNDNRIIGGWRTVRKDGDTFVIYAIQTPVTASDKELRQIISAAGKTADDKEAERTQKDEF
jgi:hypothetical protein